VPPGRHELPREFIVQHQRDRITKALAEVVAERGYRATTVADIVKAARIARNTFYDNFSSKEDCFLAAFDRAVEEAVSYTTEAYESVNGSWPNQLRAGLSAFLFYVIREPALARICIVEALSAGEEGMDRYEKALQRFVPLFAPGREYSPKASELPDTLEETIVGGIFWIVYQRIVMDQVDQLEERLPELLEFALTPYIGPEAARRAIAEAAPHSAD